MILNRAAAGNLQPLGERTGEFWRIAGGRIGGSRIASPGVPDLA
jgi:hypothetical protein